MYSLHRNISKKVLLFILLLFFILATSLSSTAENGNLTYLIRIEGQIDNGMFKLVERGIEDAEVSNVDLIIFEVDTPGGYVDPAIKIRDVILQSNVPTVGYVKGRAWSAGALISLATEDLVMLTGSSIGAAEPRPYDEKFISAFSKEFKATAEARGRNPEVAEAMVDSHIEIEGLIERDKLLTLTVGEALEHNIADYQVNNINELYDFLNIDSSSIVDIEMSLGEKAARIITRPTFTTLLIAIAIIALIAEALMPGFGVGGSIGIFSLGIVFSSYAYYGMAGWGLAFLFTIGLFLIAIEIFVIPGFGFAGLAGLFAILSSIYFLFPDPETAFRSIALIIIISFFSSIILLKIFGGSKLWKRISLEKSETLEEGYVGVSDNSYLENKKGITVTPLRPAGIAEIDGERIDVVSEGGFLARGEEIIVLKVAGNRIVVKKYLEE
ncbi:NfeD family protein [Natronospora cellulosivora (SeqCode)]